MSISAACPTRMPSISDQQHTMLTPIPPTPTTNEAPVHEDTLSPFRNNNDYFTFDVDKSSELANKETSAAQDLMHL